MKNKFAPITILLLAVMGMGLVSMLFYPKHATAAVAPSHIYAVEDTTIIYMGTGGSKYMYEDGGLGYLDVGYQGSYEEPLEVQVLLKYQLPDIPAGYEVESANLYFPVIAGNLQGAAPFSLEASSSLNHDWIQDEITLATLPAPISGSTIARSVATNAPVAKPVIGPFDFTSYVTDEIRKSNPRATFILSAFTAEQAAAADITSLDHYIQTTETHMNGTERPYLIITYTEIDQIEITGVMDGGLYNTNVTPHFNRGTATLNGALFTSGTIVSNEGTYTLVVTNNSLSKTIQFTIDKTAPTANVVINNGSKFTNHQFVDVRITPDPGVNDIVSMRYSVNESPVSTTQAYYSQFSIGVGADNGDKSVRVQLIDAAGNISPLYFWNFELNTTIPTGTIVLNQGETHTNDRDIDVDITLDVDTANIISMQFSQDNQTWSAVEPFNASKNVTLTQGDGNKTVYVRLIDQYGNIGLIHSSIILDTTPPQGGISINQGADFTNETVLELTLTTPDEGDVAGIMFSENGTDWSPMEPYVDSKQWPVTSDGTKTIYLTFYDAIGNGFITSASIYVDTVKPVVSLAIDGGAALTAEEEVSLAIEASDPGRMGEPIALSMELSHDGYSWLPAESYAESKAWTLSSGFGPKQVFVRVTDEAQNVSDVASASITYRSIPRLDASTVQAVENTPYSFDAADFPFGNDDGVQLGSYTVVELPLHGKLIFDDRELAAGAILAAERLSELLYVPNAEWFGADQLTWSAEADGIAAATNAVLTIEVARVNTAPVARNAKVTKPDYSAAQGNLDADDLDGDTLTYHLVDAPSNGRVDVNEQTGAFVFTPSENRNGTYTFTYRVYDGVDYSNTATVTITYAVANTTGIIIPPVQTGIKLKRGDDSENHFTGQADIRGSSITVKLTENDLSGLNEKNRNQAVELKLPENFLNVRVELDQKAMAKLEANGNRFVLSAKDFQLRVSHEELKQLLANKHVGLILNASVIEEGEFARLHEKAEQGGYRILGNPLAVEWLVLNEQKESLSLQDFGRMVLLYEAEGEKLVPTALLKALESGEFAPIRAYIAGDGQNHEASAAGYGSGTYALINKQPKFADVSGWSKEAVDTLASKLILNGVDASTFEPSRDITRAEFAMVISKALGLTGSNGSGNFADVAADAWYARAVAAVSGLGLINGYQDGTYRPAQAITREEAMVVVARMLHQSGFGLELGLTEQEIDEILAGYSDQGVLGQWARGDVALAIREGLISGSNGQLSVKKQITREQVAAVIVRLMKRLELL